jgi:DNA-binding response OmpR family regulator
LSREIFTLTGPLGKQRLGNKEFQMLELLMENPNRVISTEQFLSRIWGYDAETEISVVWVYISGLRKKLHAVGSTVEIRANRGVGYLLASEAREETP